jgi:AraC-like DNA-binding protein/CheY-like chemotaxis protein
MADKAHTARKRPPGARRRILVAQAPALRAQLVRALETTGDIVQVANVAQALKLLRSGRLRFDAVVLGCVPYGSAAGRIACVDSVDVMFHRWPRLPIILVAGDNETDRLGADVLMTSVRAVIRAPLRPHELVTVVRRACGSTRGQARPTSRNVAAIRDITTFLHEHVEERPTLAHLARMAAMSRSHFSRTFHAVSGMALRRYMGDRRLKRAYSLLLQSRLSLTTVAVESGFYDLPHFDKAFRGRLGTSPRAFRARYITRAAEGG